MNKLQLIILLLISSSCIRDKGTKTFETFEVKLKSSVEIFTKCRTDKLVSPRSVENNKVKMVEARDWTSGFFPGELWMMFELTENEYWKQKAIEFTLPIENEKWNGKTHDMGFKMYCSFGKAYQITKDPKYRDILLQSAKTLAGRFKPNVACIRSWDHNADKWDFPVIIDNMMNLELLFWAAKETGNNMYKDIAVSHAETTMKNHFRPDNSSYHVVDYNPETGEVQERTTHQGYSAESAWSRGQAWALYGYTMVYRETQDKRFLEQAEKVAAYILNHPNLPENLIPYWDFNAPNIPNEPRDASAAAVIASALYELSGFSEKEGKLYLKSAEEIFNSLINPRFLADPRENNGFLLKHSTGSKPHNSEIDKPLVYADYYFIEMILRRSQINH